MPTEPKNKMLSQKEMEFLRSPEKFNANYKYFLKHQIRNKVQSLSEELVLLSDAGFLNNLSEKSKSLSDFNRNLKNGISSNQASFEKVWCGRRDSNPGSLAWKAKVLNQTRRQPRKISHYSRLNLSLSGLAHNVTAGFVRVLLNFEFDC